MQQRLVQKESTYLEDNAGDLRLLVLYTQELEFFSLTTSSPPSMHTWQDIFMKLLLLGQFLTVGLVFLLLITSHSVGQGPNMKFVLRTELWVTKELWKISNGHKYWKQRIMMKFWKLLTVL